MPVTLVMQCDGEEELKREIRMQMEFEQGRNNKLVTLSHTVVKPPDGESRRTTLYSLVMVFEK